MVRASKSPKPGTVLYFEADGIEEPVMVTGRQGQFFELEFERPVLDVLEAFGRVPLPPYITHAAQKSDESRYQTVYARYPGAVAAPTAGLHFTEDLLGRRIGISDIARAPTLVKHVLDSVSIHAASSVISKA